MIHEEEKKGVKNKIKDNQTFKSNNGLLAFFKKSTESNKN